jgi:hypothetical protein
MNALILPERTLFIADTYVNDDPTRRAARRDHACMAAEEMRRFGIAPKAALLSHSQLRQRSRRLGAARCARRWRCSRERAPGLEVDGEMHGDAALDADVPRASSCRASHACTGEANLLVLPNMDAANISLQPAEDRRRRRHHDRPDAAGRGAAGAHPHALAPRCGASSTWPRSRWPMRMRPVDASSPMLAKTDLTSRKGRSSLPA